MDTLDLFTTSKKSPFSLPSQVSKNGYTIVKLQGNFVFICNNKNVYVYDLKKEFRISFESKDEITSMLLNPIRVECVLLALISKPERGTFYAVFSDDTSIKLPTIFSFYDQTFPIHGIFFHPTNLNLFLVASDRSLYAWDLSDFLTVSTFRDCQKVYVRNDDVFNSICTHIYTFTTSACAVPARNTSSSSSPYTSSETLDSKANSTHTSSTPIVALSFHPDDVHVIVLLSNKSLHCINLETKQHLSFTFLLPSFSVSLFPSTMSPSSVSSPFSPLYLSVFSHPLCADRLYIFLFDKHFDSVGYEIENDTLEEIEASSPSLPPSPSQLLENGGDAAAASSSLFTGLAEGDKKENDNDSDSEEDTSHDGKNNQLLLLNLIPVYESLILSRTTSFRPTTFSSTTSPPSLPPPPPFPPPPPPSLTLSLSPCTLR